MNLLTVTADGWVKAGGRRLKCALGRGGIQADKREGDGVTPTGLWYPEAVLYRSGYIMPPKTRMPVLPLFRNDGWCDAPFDLAYNQPVRLPFRASAEHLWRDDGVYDLIVVLDHNRHPTRPYHGSAIFMHICRSGFEPTEGCVALPVKDFRWLISRMTPQTTIQIGA